MVCRFLFASQGILSGHDDGKHELNNNRKDKISLASLLARTIRRASELKKGKTRERRISGSDGRKEPAHSFGLACMCPIVETRRNLLHSESEAKMNTSKASQLVCGRLTNRLTVNLGVERKGKERKAKQKREKNLEAAGLSKRIESLYFCLLFQGARCCK